MKAKSVIFGALSLVTLSLGFTGCSQKGDGIFGEIPSIYEDEMVDFYKDVRDLLKKGEDGNDLTPEEAILMLANLQSSMKKAEEKAQPLAEKMIGENIPYTVADSLPYRIVSDIKITDVVLPKLELSKSSHWSTRLRVEFDAVFTQEQTSVRIYYFFMNGDQPVGYDDIWRTQTMKPGDTLHVRTTVLTPSVPAEYVESCDAIRFVTEQTVQDSRESIKEQQKEWNDEFEKKLGIKND